MKTIVPKRQLILSCDNWYPKAEMTALVEQIEILEIFCNTKVGIAFYGLSPAKAEKRAAPESVGIESSWRIFPSVNREMVTG